MLPHAPLGCVCLAVNPVFFRAETRFLRLLSLPAYSDQRSWFAALAARLLAAFFALASDFDFFDMFVPYTKIQFRRSHSATRALRTNMAHPSPQRRLNESSSNLRALV